MKALNIIAASVMLLSAGNAIAKDETRASLKPWGGSSNFEYTIDSSKYDPDLGSPTSRLDYDDMKTAGIKFEYFQIRKDVYRSFSISVGKGISDGAIIDDDWFSEEYAAEINGPAMFSSTSSEASVRKSFGLELSSGYVFKGSLSSRNEYRLGGYFSYQNEEFEARGIDILSDPYDSYDFDRIFSGERVLALNTKMYSTGLDLGMRLQSDSGFFADMSVRLIPASYVDSEDYHYMRSDLNLPSVELTSLSYGGKAELSLGYKFNDISLALGAQYQIMRPYSDGDAEFDFKGAENATVDLINHDYESIQYNISLTRYF